jgi:flagellum-specific peptidoglycan hydrolase FlgJ
MGAVVATWFSRRRTGSPDPVPGGGPDPNELLLEWKAKQYQWLATRRRWDVRQPQFGDDPQFAEHASLWTQVTPETQKTVLEWQDQWDAVSSYWEKFFEGKDPGGEPPADPWGVGEIAKAQAAEHLQGQLSDFRSIVHRLAGDRSELPVLSDEVNNLWRSIEHDRHVLPSEEVQKLLRQTFAGDESVISQLMVELKKQQYRELARSGRFDQIDPQLANDERYMPFTLLKPLLDEQTNAQLMANQAAWKATALYWQARESGSGYGSMPEDVLGVESAARAAWIDFQRQQRWMKRELEDEKTSTVSVSGSEAESPDPAELPKATDMALSDEAVHRQFVEAKTNKERFLALKPEFLKAEQQTGIPWQVHAAQWALESAWGTATPSDVNTGKESFNFFGIKATGKTGTNGKVDSWTWEEIDGKEVKVLAPFRAYSNVVESIRDHTALLNTAYYAPVRQCGTDIACAVKMLGPKPGVGYATDSKYPSKLLDIIRVFESW